LATLAVLLLGTVPGWPNFRRNDSKEASKIINGRKKIEFVKLQNLAKK
jgi:hypothetical protein